jgi:hypothetical protein
MIGSRILRHCRLPVAGCRSPVACSVVYGPLK